MKLYWLVLLTACSDRLGSAEQSLTIGTWRFDPGPQWFEQDAANLPAGTLYNYEPPWWSERTAHVIRGADNEATRISGLSTTNIEAGDVRVFFNWTKSGLDSGVVAFLNEGNVRTPNAETCYASYESGMAVIFGEDRNWHVMWGCHGWQMRFKHQAWNIYPACVVAIGPGVHHDLDPQCESTYEHGGLAGGSRQFKDYALVIANVDPLGASITGLGSITGGNHDPADLGQVKILINNGPGTLDLAIEAGSSPGKALRLPNDEHIRLRPQETAILLSPASDTSIDRRWRAIALARGDVLDKLRVLGSLQAGSLELGALRTTGRVTPPPMAPTVIDVWAPVDAQTGKSFHTAYQLRVQGGVGTILCGLEPGVEGERHLVTNYESDYIIRAMCPNTPPESRFVMVGTEKIHHRGGHLEIMYDGAWMVIGN